MSHTHIYIVLYIILERLVEFNLYNDPVGFKQKHCLYAMVINPRIVYINDFPL